MVRFNQHIDAVEVTAVNILNEVVYYQQNVSFTGQSLNINLSSLVKGIYFIKFRKDNLEKTMKVVLK